jgi:hypothetical protein
MFKIYYYNKMATEFAVISIETLSIAFTYQANESQQSTYSNPWNDISKYAHIPIPSGLTLNNISVIKEGDNIIIQEDPVKTQLMYEGLWQMLRLRRNLLLSSCDWTQLSDAQITVEKKQQYSEYRQQLRNLPQNTSNPNNVVWPTEP